MPRRLFANNLRNHPLSPGCRRTQDRLLDYIDGALPQEAKRSLETHLSSCGPCRLELEKIRAAERALHSARELAPDPGDLRPGFYARLAAEKSPSNASGMSWARRARFVVPALASGLALATIAVLWIGHSGKHTMAPVDSRRSAVKPVDSGVALNRPEYQPGANLPISSGKLPSSNETTLKAKSHPVLRIATTVPTVSFATSTRPVDGLVHQPHHHPKPAPILLARLVDEPNDMKAANTYFEAASLASRQLDSTTTMKSLKTDSFSPKNFASSMRRELKLPSIGSINTRRRSDRVQFRYINEAEKTPDTSVLMVADAMPAAESPGVDLIVNDDSRGFTASTREAVQLEEHEDGDVVSIDATSSVE